MAHEDDSAWKDILDSCFEAFLELLFPAIHHDVDWSRGYEALDTQLATIVRRARTRKRLADKLVRVTLRGGDAAIILIHVEVQGDPKPDFPLRLFQCNYRIFDRRREEVITLVVLADGSPGFRPDAFERRRWGFELRMRFPVVKLLDFESWREELEASPNPFALVVLAHLDARRTRKRPAEAFDAKWRLTRMLYVRGHDRENIASLYRFIDWVLRLPDELEDELEDRLRTLEGDEPMPYLSRIERRAMEQGREEGKQAGREEGLLDAIRLLLRQRFGDAGLALLPRLGPASDASLLRSCLEAIAAAGSLDDLERILPLP